VTREEARAVACVALERALKQRGGSQAEEDCIADAILAAVTERDKAWREWLRLRFSGEWIATCGDLPDRQPAPEGCRDG
jgi:hypothetical protein